MIPRTVPKGAQQIWQVNKIWNSWVDQACKYGDEPYSYSIDVWDISQGPILYDKSSQKPGPNTPEDCGHIHTVYKILGFDDGVHKLRPGTQRQNAISSKDILEFLDKMRGPKLLQGHQYYWLRKKNCEACRNNPLLSFVFRSSNYESLGLSRFGTYYYSWEE
jgi:hypothetical protein